MFTCIVGCSNKDNNNVKPSINNQNKKEEDSMNVKDDITRIAFIGDSITSGYLTSNPETTAFPGVLAEILGDKFEIKNFGFGGACAISNLDDNNVYSKKEKYYRNSDEYKRSIDYDADIVIVMLGTNDRVSVYPEIDKLNKDGLNSFKYWLSDICEEYKNRGSKVYIASSILSPVDKQVAYEYLDGMVQGFQEEVAKENGYIFIDIYKFIKDDFKDTSCFNSDKLHPNDEGHKLIAQAFMNYFNDGTIKK